jgi:hypothetical protein
MLLDGKDYEHRSLVGEPNLTKPWRKDYEHRIAPVPSSRLEVPAGCIAMSAVSLAGLSAVQPPIDAIQLLDRCDRLSVRPLYTSRGAGEDESFKAAPADCSPAESILRLVAQSIYDRIAEVAVASSVARERVTAACAAACATGVSEDTASDYHQRSHVLLDEVDSIAASKVAALEAELVALDAVLERIPRELEAIRTEACALSVHPAPTDDDRSACQRLHSRLDALEGAVNALPAEPVEPAAIVFTLETPDPAPPGSQSATASNLGSVEGMRAITAAAVKVGPLPGFARAGSLLTFTVECIEGFLECGRAADEANAVLGRLLRVSVSLLPCVSSLRESPQLPPPLARPASGGAAAARNSHPTLLVGRQESMPCSHVAAFPESVAYPLKVSVGYERTGCCRAVVSITVPLGVPHGSAVQINSVAVAGAPSTHVPGFPLSVIVVGGLAAPLDLADVVHGFSTQPCSSIGGTLYLPDEGCAYLRCFGPAGQAKEPLALSRLHLSDKACVAAVDDSLGVLILGDANDRKSKIVAVDTATLRVLWTAGAFNSCGGVALLPQHGVVVASSYKSDFIHVHRLADGARIATATAPDPTYVAADPATGTVYVSSDEEVRAWRWDGSALVPLGRIVAALAAASRRPLAVLPPAPGKSLSHLVVGEGGQPGISVLALPAHTLVCDVLIPDARGRDAPCSVWGLAGDPTGTALLVCDPVERSLCVLPWPLPGMPPLA